MTEEPLDLRRVLGLLHRRKRTVAGFLAAGLVCGVLLTVLKGPTYEARAGVLLPPSTLDASGRPLRNILTESRIASSAQVLGPAGKALDPPVSASRAAARVKVSAVGADILEIRAEAASARDAVTLANAIAKEYVAFANSAGAEQANTAMTLLQDRAAELQNEISKLDIEIATETARLGALSAGSPGARQQEALIDSQRTTQVEAARELSNVNSRITDARLNAELTRKGLRVIEPATTPSQPWRRQALMSVGVGGALGLMAGAVLVVYLGHGDRRLRSRDEIARAVGVPVLTSLAVGKPKGVDQWRDLLEKWTPGASERLVLRQAFTRMGEPHKQMPTNVAVVTLPGDTAALALAVELAAFSADFGIPTRLIFTLHDHSAASLRSACALTSRRGSEVRPHLRIMDGTKGLETTNETEAYLTITIAALDQDKLSIPSWGLRTSTVLAVSSGFATGDALAAAVLACEDGEQRVAGVLVANPESDDHTMGTVPFLDPMTTVFPPVADAPTPPSSSITP